MVLDARRPAPQRRISHSRRRRDDMSRPRVRREPAGLRQIPVWGPEIVRPGERAADPDHGVAALLAGLNRDQLRAVTHGAGPLLIVAGAGTGKTQVITRRIAWLIAHEKVRPSEILALTFTDKAAEEMSLRVDQLVPYGYTDTAISTFHAFGDRLIREFAIDLGLPLDVRVLSRAEVVVFLREHLFELGLERFRPLGDPTRFLRALATHFSRCKDEDVSPARYLEHAERRVAEAAQAAAACEAAGGRATTESREAAAAPTEEAVRTLELARAYGRYQDLLGRAGYLDFGDQVSLALTLLRDSTALRRRVQARFRYILVDEFQDTNRAQFELVALLAQGHGNITVVGDDDQSIYRFRGAAISNILGFQQRYPRARLVVLRRNYRSRAPILEAAYRLIRHNDPDRLEVRAGIVKRLRSERPVAGASPVRSEGFATGSDEADWIAAEIGRRIAAGAAPRDHAVLVRTNAGADPIVRAFNVAGIPWRFSGTSGLYARPEIRLLLAALRTIADLGSSPDLYALAASEVYGLGGEDLTAIVNAARRRNRTIWEVVEELTRQPGLLRLSPATRPVLERLVADLRRWTDLAHERPTGEVLYVFLRESGLLARWSAPDASTAEESLRNVARFFELIRDHGELAADPRPAFLVPHLAALLEAGDDPATVDLDPDADAVAVLTVHKAKGLEFPTVFLAGLVAGRFPTAGRRDPLPIPEELFEEVAPEGEVELQEERRLFYVAMTRARDELILCHAADYGGARVRRISPFVLEALDQPSAVVAPGAGAAGPAPLERLASFRAVVPPSEGARAPVTEPLMLSFGAIDAYLTCPAKYRYGHVLRIPVAPHHAMVYGAAMHAAVQEFHRRHAKGEVMSDEALAASFEAACTSEGFLTREHEEARLAAGRAALRRFREDQLKPDAVIPAYVEREFMFSLGGDRIRGRWDRVDIEPVATGAPVGPGAEAVEVALPATHDTHGGSMVEVLPDVVEDTLPLLPRERVTITDYKSSDVRDPAVARQRARESLQLAIYALAYQAQTGRLPDAVQLWFLDSGVIGRAELDPKRLARARGRIAQASEGIRARDFTARPDPLACGYCPYRDICPSSATA
jgi:DNA helicase-2/ATP-dependent DNA helicase PcrA